LTTKAKKIFRLWKWKWSEIDIEVIEDFLELFLDNERKVFLNLRDCSVKWYATVQVQLNTKVYSSFLSIDINPVIYSYLISVAWLVWGCEKGFAKFAWVLLINTTRVDVKVRVCLKKQILFYENCYIKDMNKFNYANDLAFSKLSYYCFVFWADNYDHVRKTINIPTFSKLNCRLLFRMYNFSYNDSFFC